MNAATTPAEPTANGGKRRRALLIVTTIFVLIAIGWIVMWYFVLSVRETTDDAYVSGNLVTISAQQAGTVIAVMADDTQRVDSGQVLVKLDPTDTEVSVNQAAAALAQTVRQIREQSATASQFDAAIRSREVELALAQADLERRRPLVAARAIAPEELTHAQSSVDQARAALTSAQRQAAAAHALVDGTDIAHQPAVLQAKAVYQQAWVAAARNTIPAPLSGYIAQRSVQVGQRISAGQALMTVVPLSNLWIDANFKESQLRHLRMGQKAEIRSDVYGSEAVFHGRIAGVAAGTGAAFSLLPAQNASGNWIKVVQRVPVRIELDPNELKDHPLRIGLSTDVNVDTHDRSGPLLATAANATPVADTDVYQRAFEEAQKQADAIIAEQTRTR